MTPGEREEFELVLGFNPELRNLIYELQQVASALAMAQIPAELPSLSPESKSTILQRLVAESRISIHESVVVTGPDRLVRWVNSEFTAMCGYSLAELEGKKLGPLLQGPATDIAAVMRIRAALDAEGASRETLVNYHKDGSPYLVEIAITPIRDDQNRLRWFVARERLLEKLAA
jgi:PAS domain S-box-containing protein